MCHIVLSDWIGTNYYGETWRLKCTTQYFMGKIVPKIWFLPCSYFQISKSLSIKNTFKILCTLVCVREKPIYELYDIRGNKILYSKSPVRCHMLIITALNEGCQRSHKYESHFSNLGKPWLKMEKQGLFTALFSGRTSFGLAFRTDIIHSIIFKNKL